MNHIKFPHINQVRQVIKSIRDSATFHNLPLPKVKFELTGKTHGSNGAWVRPFNGTKDDIRFQSRERMCTIESDNAGFALFSTSKLDLINTLMDRIASKVQGEADDFIQVYMEWAGSTIQKGVGITGLDKFCIIFGIRVSKDAESSEWVQRPIYEELFGTEELKTLNQNNIYTKYQFWNDVIEIDTAEPETAINWIVAKTDEIEKDCPIARFFKPDAEVGTLVGEGLVGTAIQEDHIGFSVKSHFWKSKGVAHSNSKVKTTNGVDIEKMNSINEFVEKALTDNRMNQGLEKLREQQLQIIPENVSNFIKFCVSDVMREEADTIVDSNLDSKAVAKRIATVAREFYFKNLDI